MTTENLYFNIKRLCQERGITINQLEKELGFGAGSIGKFQTSSPSIEKICRIAKNFDVSVDQLCGLDQERSNGKLENRLVSDTENGSLSWKACSINEVPQINGARFQDSLLEVLFKAEPSGKPELAFYLFHTEEQSAVLVKTPQNGCIWKQDMGNLEDLWAAVRQQLEDREAEALGKYLEEE